MAQAVRDDNRVTALLGVSSADGVTPLPVKIDPATGRVLVEFPGAGNVVGPASSVDNEIPRFDGVTGKLLKDSGVITLDSVGTFTSSAEMAFSDTNKAGSTFAGLFKLSETSAEWDAFEVNFGEVSLVNALNQAAGGGGAGDVIGPASSTDDEIVRFLGATGKIIKDSGVTFLNSTGVFSTSSGNMAFNPAELVTSTISLDADNEFAWTIIATGSGDFAGTGAQKLSISSGGMLTNGDFLFGELVELNGNAADVAGTLLIGSAIVNKNAVASSGDIFGQLIELSGVFGVKPTNTGGITGTTTLITTSSSTGSLKGIEISVQADVTPPSNITASSFTVTPNIAGIGLVEGVSITNSGTQGADNGVSIAGTWISGIKIDGAVGTGINIVNSSVAIEVSGSPIRSSSSNLTLQTITSGDVILSSVGEITFNDTNKVGSTYAGVLKLSETSGEFDTFEINFGEVSLINAINQAAASAGSGDVSGPASSTDNEIVRFNGATGKIIKDSGVVTLSAAGVFARNTGDLVLTNTTSGDVQMLALTDLVFSDGNKSTSTFSSELILSDSATEWNTFETNFGEVSILNAISQALTGVGGNTLDQAYDQGGAGVGNTIAADSGAVIIFTTVGANNAALELTQNDSTNDPNALTVTNAANGNGVVIDQTATLNAAKDALRISTIVAHSSIAGSLLKIDNINASSANESFTIFSNGIGTTASIQQAATLSANNQVFKVSSAIGLTNTNTPLVQFSLSSASSTEEVLDIVYAGTGNAQSIEQNGTGSGLIIKSNNILAAGKHALEITSSVLQLNESLVKISHTSTSDASSESLEIDHRNMNPALRITSLGGGINVSATVSGDSPIFGSSFTHTRTIPGFVAAGITGFLIHSTFSGGGGAFAATLSALEVICDNSTDVDAFAIEIKGTATGAGATFAFLFGGTFAESSAVPATQDKRVKVMVGTTTYYIPLYR